MAYPTNSMTNNKSRRGTVAVLTAFLMVFMLAAVALALDLGYLMLVRTELQRSADGAALAAAWDLITESPSPMIGPARNTAANYVGLNDVAASSPSVDLNAGNDPGGDIVVGTISDFGVLNPTMSFGDPDQFNAVRVRVRRNGNRNGEVPLFFANVLGVSSSALQADATAVLIRNLRGFRAPESPYHPNVPLLPITLHEETWNALMAGAVSQDDWGWVATPGTIVAGGDGIAEANLYPERNGSPGNFGTVNIGTSANDTNHLSHQILHGLSPADLAYHGGELKLGDNGTMSLSGDTGISASIKDELHAIRGIPRIIPIYREVAGTGNNALYTIVKFVGIRIMRVQLTGQNMQLVIQPADVVSGGVIPSDTNTTSEFVFSPCWLVD